MTMKEKRKTNARRVWKTRQPAEAAMKPDTCKRIREGLGLTQVEFARMLGVKSVAVSRWETGAPPISQGRALAIKALKQRETA